MLGIIQYDRELERFMHVCTIARLPFTYTKTIRRPLFWFQATQEEQPVRNSKDSGFYGFHRPYR